MAPGGSSQIRFRAIILRRRAARAGRRAPVCAADIFALSLGADPMTQGAFPLRTVRAWHLTIALICAFVSFPSLSSGQEEFDGESFESAGTRIHYEVIGKGARSPIIVINGGPGFDHTYLHLSSVWETLAHDGPVVF